ncbi:MAG: hypothetical protein ACREM3_01300 [Candidatus Rokuibacteriota bacterium]
MAAVDGDAEAGTAAGRQPGAAGEVGAMDVLGALAADRRYVMTIEIPRPKSTEDLEKVNKIVADLKDEFGAAMKLSITGSK